MKTHLTILCAMLLCVNGYSQQSRKDHKPFTPPTLTQAKGLMKNEKSLPAKSFYKSKENWSYIVDTAWGPGMPLEEKLHLFDTYTDSVTHVFAGFKSLGITPSDWESIRASCRSRITDTTSRGDFAAIMSHLSYSLCDAHGWAIDDLENAFSPGYPVVEIGKGSNHLGVVYTSLPDSTLVVLRSLEDHPLGLQRGDILLGYEGVPWKDLVDELLTADLPMDFMQRGAKSARRHSELLSMGNNWHLFDTIDIVKYSTGDTVHLPVAPLLDLPVSIGNVWEEGPRENLMWNNEQLPVPGVPMLDPNDLDTNSVSYGIVEGTNIGYIYLYVEYGVGDVGIQYSAWNKFHEAFLALKETDGLIIDLRHNHGGYIPYQNKTLSLLFNEITYTMDEAYRCSISDFDLCPEPENSGLYTIYGDPMTLYDRPLAVLIGPNDISAGEVTAQVLRYHPMVNFFGKPTPGSLMFYDEMNDFPGWRIWYTHSDLFHVNSPGEYINLQEFPVDVPVWFNLEDVANGVDPVVEKALEWIDSLSYAHDVSAQSHYLAGGETVRVVTQVENPGNHLLTVYGKIRESGGEVIDSVPFYDDGTHGDGEAGDGIWGLSWELPEEELIFAVDVSTQDTTAGTLRTLPQVVQFTSAGPVEFEDYHLADWVGTPNPGEKVDFKISLRNSGSAIAVNNIVASLTSLDPIASLNGLKRVFDDIASGEAQLSKGGNYSMIVSEDCPVGKTIPIAVEIFSNDYLFWTDTFSITIEPDKIENLTESEISIYPNPATGELTIEFENEQTTRTSIELLDISGKVVYSGTINPGETQHQFNLTSYEEGLYLIRISNTDYTVTKKVIKID